MKKFAFPVFLFLFAFFLLFGYSLAYRSSVETITISVIGRDRVKHGDDDEKYVVYTTTETFENVDSWTFFKFNSADFQGKLNAGKIYKVKVAGWRLPIANSFRNIIEIEK